ncbi:MAG: sialate O-acetylesterase, partial [Mariniblastus sp.]|nr:sialate O-acetylesterase [Mariniblastus sp.]
MRLLIVLLLSLLGHQSCARELHVAQIFGDRMVLQQNTNVAIWGWADPGKEVTAQASWGSQSATRADPNGRWIMFIKTPESGIGYTLTIACDKSIEFNEVAIGEVWLCLGQSNMGWSTGNSFGAERQTSVNLSDLRIYRSEREHWHQPLEKNRDQLAQWKMCDQETASETSAVAFYFGKQLQQELGVPVGIIQRAYAGTPIEGWMPWEIQQIDTRTIEHKQSLDRLAQRRAKSAGETRIKAIAQFQKELTEYEAKIAAGQKMKNAKRQLSPPIITKPVNLGHQYPGHIYNAMIRPIVPYGIRGMVWYQGERNSKNSPQAYHYRKQLKQLIEFYRNLWHEESGGNIPDDFPFQFTQLPSWNPPQQTPIEGPGAPWVVNRDSMNWVDQNVLNTSLAVTIDTGDSIDLHPKNKQPIGLRHAFLALRDTYGKELVASGPRFLRHQVAGHRMVLTFSHIGSGLVSAKPGPLTAFAMAGADRKWHWAKATVDGDTI